ncbi:extracellular solute-binding protein [Acidihalobacter prosperus]
MYKRLLNLVVGLVAMLALPVHAAQTLVVYSSGPASLARALAHGFEQRTGAKVDLYTASTGKVMARLAAEKSHPRADVVILANWTAGLALADQKEVYPFHPADIVKRLRPALDTKGPFLPVGGDTVSIVVNTRKVTDPQSLDDWFALKGTRWQHQVTMPSPLLSGTASDFVLAFTARYGERAWNYFKALKAEGTIWPGPNAAALRPVELGARSAMLSAVGHTSLKAKHKGNALALVFPKSGTVLIPRPILIMRSAHDKALAERFVRYSLSAQGQKLVSSALLIPAVSSVQPAAIWPDLSSVKFISADWQKLASHRTRVLERFRHDILGQ